MNIRNRADMAVAQGALTNSKRPQSFIENVYPTHAKWGKGSTLYCDGKPYLDYIGANGTNLLGYGHPIIQKAVSDQFLRGACLSLSSEIEVELAERLKGVFRFTDLWKLFKTGSDACLSAIKIARAFTGKDLVLSQAYHGWGDDFVSLSPPALGVPKRDWIKPLDMALIKDAACVIIEAVELDISDERRQWLQKLREECTKYGTVLIFDEIITGFRFPKMCVSNYWGIEPDMICIGKAMAGGMPLSAVGGRKDIMNCGEYFISGTFFGETCSIAACLATLDLLQKDSSRYDLNDLWRCGQMFMDRFNMITDKLKIVGYPTRGAFRGDEMFKALFFQETCKAKILFGPSWFFNFCHIEHTDVVISICRDIISKIRNGQVQLEGNLPVTPFAQKLRS